MELQHINERLKRILAEDLDLNLATSDIDDAMSLLDDGLALDSINLAEFIDRIENAFSIRVRDEDLESLTFSSLPAVAALVKARMQESAHAPPAGRVAEEHAS